MGSTPAVARVEAVVEVERPAEQLFAVLADVRRLPEVSSMTVAVTGAPERLSGVGETFSQRVRILGRELDSDWTVTAFEEGRLVQAAGTSNLGGRISLEERVTPLGPARCRLDYSFEYVLPGSIVGRLAARAVEGRARKEAQDVLASLKAKVEAQPVGP